MKINKLNLLDCTLRDGGYYNNWKFNLSDANKYLKGVYASEIDVVEIGFNFFEKNSNYGKFAFADKSLAKKLIKSKKTKLAIMINGSDFFKIKGDYKKFLNKNFKNKILDYSIIRIAAHYRDLKKLTKYLKYLKKLNYKICFNLMQINNISKKQLVSCLKKLDSTKSVDVFYFADSFGNLKPNNVKYLCKIIKKNWKKEIGIHAHDNCGRALKNSLTAFKNGVTWIDGTIQGMGRGAGNVKTESLLKEFSHFKYNYAAVKNISNNFFLDLKKKYKWGKSNYYKIAANFNIHPTYIQMLQNDNRYSISEKIESINSLKKIEATSYDPRKLEESFINYKKFKGNWDATNWCSNKNILILGQGPSLKNKQNIKKIEQHILETKSTVVAINLNKYISQHLVDYYVSANETRIPLDQHKYENLLKPLIIPKFKLKKIKEKINKIRFLDYGVVVKNKKFEFYKNFAIIPYNLTFAYAVALALIGKAKKIYFAGFDGYKKNHRLSNEMQETIEIILKNNKSLKLNSLTKTEYKFF